MANLIVVFKKREERRLKRLQAVSSPDEKKYFGVFVNTKHWKYKSMSDLGDARVEAQKRAETLKAKRIKGNVAVVSFNNEEWHDIRKTVNTNNDMLDVPPIVFDVINVYGEDRR